MSWERIGADRWRWTGLGVDVERHLLVRLFDEYRELHGTTVHVYVQPWPHHDDAPLMGAEHQATYTNPGDWVFTDDMTDDDLFSWLEAGGYQ